jgi:hypothetical protein
LFCVPASEAPVVAVLRRGPSAWTHLGRWDLAHDRYDGGAWIKANLYPQRCDVSPDGEFFTYLAAKGPGTWAAGTTYLAVSRLPWVFALAAWGTCGTWTRGVHFADPDAHELGDPDEGTIAPMRGRYGLVYNRPVAFAVERRRGWIEAEETPPRDPDRDPWDERRAPRVVMEKPRDGSGVALRVQGAFAAFREGPFRNEPRDACYTLVVRGDPQPLDDVQWADWADDGRLLVATVDGRLQARAVGDDGAALVWEHDVAALQPDPVPAPPAARRWS